MGESLVRNGIAGIVFCLLCSVPALAGATERTTAAVLTAPPGVTIAAGDPFSYTHVCDPSLASTGPSTNDAAVPGPGQLRYYLVSGANGCGVGDVGTDSSGNSRPYFPCGEN